MSTELVTTQPHEVSVVVTEEQKELVKRTVAPDATDSELQLYFYDCTRRGVHPLDRLLHFTKRKDGNGVGKYTPITSIDLLRMRADSTGQHIGTDEPIYQGAKGSPDFAALVRVHKLVAGQKATFTGTARWSEYYPGDRLGFMWQKMPHLMLGKCAEALALRKAFPAQLHGLYVQEEMDQAEVKPVESSAKERMRASLHEAAQELSGEPVDITIEETGASDPQPNPSGFVWRLGKYKGTLIDEIPLNYLEWFAKEGKAGDHKAAAQAAIDWAKGQQSLGTEDVA